MLWYTKERGEAIQAHRSNSKLLHTMHREGSTRRRRAAGLSEAVCWDGANEYSQAPEVSGRGRIESQKEVRKRRM